MSQPRRYYTTSQPAQGDVPPSGPPQPAPSNGPRVFRTPGFGNIVIGAGRQPGSVVPFRPSGRGVPAVSGVARGHLQRGHPHSAWAPPTAVGGGSAVGPRPSSGPSHFRLPGDGGVQPFYPSGRGRGTARPAGATGGPTRIPPPFFPRGVVPPPSGPTGGPSTSSKLGPMALRPIRTDSPDEDRRRLEMDITRMLADSPDPVVPGLPGRGRGGAPTSTSATSGTTAPVVVPFHPRGQQPPVQQHKRMDYFAAAASGTRGARGRGRGRGRAGRGGRGGRGAKVPDAEVQVRKEWRTGEVNLHPPTFLNPLGAGRAGRGRGGHSAFIPAMTHQHHGHMSRGRAYVVVDPMRVQVPHRGASGRGGRGGIVPSFRTASAPPPTSPGDGSGSSAPGPGAYDASYRHPFHPQAQQYGPMGPVGPPPGVGVGVGYHHLQHPGGGRGRGRAQQQPRASAQATTARMQFPDEYSRPAGVRNLRGGVLRAYDQLPTVVVPGSPEVRNVALGRGSFATPVAKTAIMRPLDTVKSGKDKAASSRGPGSLTSTPYRRFASLFLDASLKTIVQTPHMMRQQCNIQNPFKHTHEFHTFYHFSDEDKLRHRRPLFAEKAQDRNRILADMRSQAVLNRQHFKALDSTTSDMVFITSCSYPAAKHAVVVSQTKFWSSLELIPEVVKMRKVFDDADLRAVFVYDYIFGAVTLSEWWTGNVLPQRDAAPRASYLWCVLSHCLTALKHIHQAGLTYRILHPSKILVVPSASSFQHEHPGMTDDGKKIYTTSSHQKTLKRFSCKLGSGGIANCMWDLGDGRVDLVRRAQREDVMMLGQMCANLALGQLNCDPWEHSAVTKNWDAVATTLHDATLVEFLQSLARGDVLKNIPLDSPSFVCNIAYDTLDDSMARQLRSEVSYLKGYNSFVLSQLESEVENGRLFKLLLKIQFFVHQLDAALLPEDDPRILCKLFFDYLFQASSGDSDQGSGKLDWARVIESLNKLDAGVPEEVLLKSQDEKIIIVASFAEIKKSFATAFEAFLKE